MTPPAPWSIGIDIGGTKIAVAAVAADGTVLDRVGFPTEAELGFPRAVDRLTDVIRSFMTRLDIRSGPAGIGIGCAGPVDPARGLINNPYTLTGWDRCDIVTPLRERFGMPVLLENDADAAALGECRAGAGRGFDPMVMLTFGTGVGGGAVFGGRVLRGAKGKHPELGHIPVLPGGPSCYCGIAGCLESVASGTAIAEAGRPAHWNAARDVFAAARAGAASAQAIVTRAIDATATAAWTIFHTLLPERLVLGGGIMDTEFEPFAAAIRQRIAGATQFTPRNVDVARATLGNDAGLVGAAGLVLDRNDS